MDKGTEFKGFFEALFKKKGIKTYSTENEKRSEFAERKIRSLKNLIYKYSEDIWSYSGIEKLEISVSAIGSRKSHITCLATKIAKKNMFHA